MVAAFGAAFGATVHAAAVFALATGASAFSLSPAPRLTGRASRASLLLMTVESTETKPTAVMASESAEDLGKVFQRAEFWDKQKATKLEVINVLGRWESASEWVERTEFTEIQNVRSVTYAQSATRERYQMAQRLGQAERVDTFACNHVKSHQLRRGC